MQKLIIYLCLTYLLLTSYYTLSQQLSIYCTHVALVSLFCWFMFCRNQQSIMQHSVARLKNGNFASMNFVDFKAWII